MHQATKPGVSHAACLMWRDVMCCKMGGPNLLQGRETRNGKSCVSDVPGPVKRARQNVTCI